MMASWTVGGNTGDSLGTLNSTIPSLKDMG